MNHLLNAFELAKDGRGRRAYVTWLEKRAANEGGKVDDAAMKALQRGNWGQVSHFNIFPEKILGVIKLPGI